jgi:hypothetical protein
MHTIVPTNFLGKSDLCSVHDGPDHVIDHNLSDLAAPSYLLLERDRRLSYALEEVLRNAIQADTPDLSVDLAVRKSWPGYWPGTRRWEPLDYPNSHWITCQTGENRDQGSQVVHVNLLDGSLLVDGWPIGERLPSVITEHPMYHTIFGDVHTCLGPHRDTGC